MVSVESARFRGGSVLGLHNPADLALAWFISTLRAVPAHERLLGAIPAVLGTFRHGPVALGLSVDLNTRAKMPVRSLWKSVCGGKRLMDS